MFRIIENCLNSFEFYFVDLWYFVFFKKNRSRTSQLKYSDPEQVRQGISYRISSYFIQTWKNHGNIGAKMPKMPKSVSWEVTLEPGAVSWCQENNPNDITKEEQLHVGHKSR
jgi:hypothetical protein